MVDDLSARFARNVRSLREQRGLSQAQLAQRMATYGHRWMQNTIQRIEHQQRRVDIAEADALAHALDVTVGALLATGDPDDTSDAGRIRRALDAVDAAAADLDRSRRRYDRARTALADLNPSALTGDAALRSAALAALAEGSDAPRPPDAEP
ncbi:hypothetical protein MAHJHV61_37330 [Mycobacterium avium subsp. hominissuis]|uniref:HTH cro/C1-type domain-containing protein n=3 Tax=Mycobacterium TaxID=1763 RepID=A0AA37PYU4_9MYCO|nr:helix-turn-helix transcriptional regulator [Mycobacterium avium]ORW03039.1 hypothetical protein AWC14_05560 [Mycobacterium kyorinense]GLB86745.1 hypothetical protein SRL2020028_60010 [Mycobacterium kiyosense]